MPKSAETLDTILKTSANFTKEFIGQRREIKVESIPEVSPISLVLTSLAIGLARMTIFSRLNYFPAFISI